MAPLGFEENAKTSWKTSVFESSGPAGGPAVSEEAIGDAFEHREMISDDRAASDRDAWLNACPTQLSEAQRAAIAAIMAIDTRSTAARQNYRKDNGW